MSGASDRAPRGNMGVGTAALAALFLLLALVAGTCDGAAVPTTTPTPTKTPSRSPTHSIPTLSGTMTPTESPTPTPTPSSTRETFTTTPTLTDGRVDEGEAKDCEEVLEGLGENEGHPPTEVFFVIFNLLIGALVRRFAKHSSVPYTVLMFIIGIGLGIAHNLSESIAERLGTNLAFINPSVFLFIFLPGLIFESAFSMDVHVFTKVLPHCLILAGPGLLIASFLTALTMSSFFKTWTFVESLLFGAILSATDPVAVVALLKTVGASKYISTIIEGESLLNDGVAIVLFSLLRGAVHCPKTLTPTGIIVTFFRFGLGGPLWGWIAGRIGAFFVKQTFQDGIVEIMISFMGAYLVFYLAEVYLRVSGVLAVVAFGTYFSGHHYFFSPEVKETLHHFWEIIAWCANTVIFTLVGIQVVSQTVSGSLELAKDYSLLIGLYLAINVIRFIVIMVAYPMLRYLFWYKMEWRECVLAGWGGLRGAVGLALALSLRDSAVTEETREENPFGITQEYADKVTFLVSGIVMLTLIVNGMTTRSLVHYLYLAEATPERRKLMERMLGQIQLAEARAVRVWRTDPVLADSHWGRVAELVDTPDIPKDESWLSKRRKRRYQELLEENAQVNEMAGDGGLAASDMNLKKRQELQQMSSMLLASGWAPVDEMEKGRLMLLRAFKQGVHNQYEQGLNFTHSLRILDGLADDIIDQTGKLGSYRMFDNHFLGRNFNGVHWTHKYLQVNNNQGLIRLRATPSIRQIRHAFDLGVCFVAAQEHVVPKIDQLIGVAELQQVFRKRVREGIQQASLRMTELNQEFPNVCLAVKTRYISRVALNHGRDKVNKAIKDGLLDRVDGETFQEHLSKQMYTLRSLGWNFQQPDGVRVLLDNPPFDDLPDGVKYMLEHNSREIPTAEETKITVAQQVPLGLGIVVRGIIRIEEEDFTNYIGPGCVFNVLSVLTGVLSPSEVTAHTTGECRIIETDVILQVVREYPAVEDYLWATFGKQVGHNLLVRRFPYSSWPTEQFKSRIEASTLMRLESGREVTLWPRFEYVLCYGSARAVHTGREYVAPAILPNQLDIDKQGPEWIESVVRMREAFDHFDDDGSGMLELDELEGALKQLGHNFSPEEVKALLRDLDADGSGTIEFDEFVSLSLNFTIMANEGTRIMQVSRHDKEDHFEEEADNPFNHTQGRVDAITGEGLGRSEGSDGSYDFYDEEDLEYSPSVMSSTIGTSRADSGFHPPRRSRRGRMEGPTHGGFHGASRAPHMGYPPPRGGRGRNDRWERGGYDSGMSDEEGTYPPPAF